MENKKSNPNLKVIILAGGGGTRLFPLSRDAFPKQFLKLFDGLSLFQRTIQRSLILSEPEDIIVMTGDNYISTVREQLDEMGCKACCVLSNSIRKNTLPAIYYGVKYIEHISPGSIVGIFPSDHLIDTDDNYMESIEKAIKLSQLGKMIVFGVKPTSPHTGYGYIKPLIEVDQSNDGGFTVEAFIEKPDLEKAKEFVNSQYLWNSGMFFFRSDIFLRESKEYAKDVVEALDKPLDEAFKQSINNKQKEIIDEAYKKAPEISIDYGIMEHTKEAVVVPFLSKWNDLGTFDALYSTLKQDHNKNSVIGEHLGIDSCENIIISDRLVITIGVNNHAIIETKDVILVSKRDQSHLVGHIVNDLLKRDDKRALLHTDKINEWGSISLLEENNEKIIQKYTLLPGMQLILDRVVNSGNMFAICGSVKMKTENGEMDFKNGDSYPLKPGLDYELNNKESNSFEFILVEYFL